MLFLTYCSKAKKALTGKPVGFCSFGVWKADKVRQQITVTRPSILMSSSIASVAGHDFPDVRIMSCLTVLAGFCFCRPKPMLDVVRFEYFVSPTVENGHLEGFDVSAVRIEYSRSRHPPLGVKAFGTNSVMPSSITIVCKAESSQPNSFTTTSNIVYVPGTTSPRVVCASHWFRDSPLGR